jgi:hypothetical protein
MQAPQAHAEEAAAAAALATALAHAVIFSEDLWRQHLWRWLDPGAKAALRFVSKRMRDQVDATVEVVQSPSSGTLQAGDLASVLVRWPAVRELTLFNVDSADELAPLSTASLAGLTSLTLRQVGGMHDPHARACTQDAMRMRAP